MENQKLMGVLAGGVLLGGVLGAGVVFTTMKNKVGGSISAEKCSVDGAGSSNPNLFTYKGKDFTREGLPQDVRNVIYEIEKSGYDQMSGVLKEYALRLEIAEKKGIKQEAGKPLPSTQELLGIKEPTNEDVSKFLKERNIKLPDGISMEQVRPQIVQALMQQKSQEAMLPYRDTVMNGFKLTMSSPIAPVANFDLKAYASKGPANAIEVVLVSDYMCPHCRKAKPEVDATIKEFGDKVRFIPVVFPLNNDGLNVWLAKGAYCAQQQNMEAFWKYDTEAYAVPPEAVRAVSPDKDKEFAGVAEGIAKKVGLDGAKFSTCLQSKEAKDFVANTTKIMQESGVHGTPTLFVNKRRIDGNTPLNEAIKAAM